MRLVSKIEDMVVNRTFYIVSCGRFVAATNATLNSELTTYNEHFSFKSESHSSLILPGTAV